MPRGLKRYQAQARREAVLHSPQSREAELVEKPEDWPWSSSRHYLTGEEGVVEIESLWPGRKREQMGSVPLVKITKPLLAPPQPKPG